MTTSREHAIGDVEADAHNVTLGSDREAQGVEADYAESLSLTQTFREPRARQNQVDQGTKGLRTFAGVDADQGVARPLLCVIEESCHQSGRDPRVGFLERRNVQASRSAKQDRAEPGAMKRLQEIEDRHPGHCRLFGHILWRI
jgi:hypothetical protein